MKRKEIPLLRIGIFVLVGFIILMVFVFLIGSKQKLFTTTAIYYARFSTVSDLKTGAQVQIAGINVGNVTSIKLPKRSKDSVTVTMKIEEDALPLIRVDSRASITTQGLIGDKYIMILAGSDTVPVLSPGSTIHGEELKEFSRIYDTLSVAVSQVTTLTKQVGTILQDVKSGKGSLGKLIYDEGLYRDLQGLTTDARGAVNQVTSHINTLSDQIQGITTKINNGEGSVGKLLTSDDLYNGLRSTEENFRLSSVELRDAMAKLALGTGRFAEDAEALKHNFLFKGYFESRGYWDAPDFEQTIDRKIDSLNQLTRTLEEQLRQQRMSGHPPAH